MKVSKKSLKKGVHGTKEWSSSSKNIQTGCPGGCLYCYARDLAAIFGQCQPENWGNPVIRLEEVSKNYRKRKGRIMCPSSHDITPSNIDAVMVVLKKMLTAGNEVLIVSKPWLECIKRICTELAEYKDQILFRFSIGSTEQNTLSFWEPGAPAFEERLASLKWTYEQGFQTSVSTEPMLDTKVEGVIKAVRPYVTDSIWLGKAGRLKTILGLTCPGNAEVQHKADELLEQQSDEWVHGLYAKYRNDPMIKWKDSIKKIVGIEIPTEKGLDV